MDKKKKRKKRDDITLLRDELNKLIKMRNAEKNCVESIRAIVKRLHDDKSDKQLQEVSKEIDEAIETIKLGVNLLRAAHSRH